MSYVSLLNEHSQKMRLPAPEYTYEQLTATPPLWSCIVKLGDFSADGKGQNKQAAKDCAAQKLVEKLKDEQIWHTDFGKKSPTQKTRRRDFIDKIGNY